MNDSAAVTRLKAWIGHMYIRRRYPEHHSPVVAHYDGDHTWAITVLSNGATFEIDHELFDSVFKRAPTKVVEAVIRTYG